MSVETLLKTEWTEPDGIAPRGTVVVVGGRSETEAVYGRFGRRISSDAYRVRFVDGDLSDLDDLARRIDAALGDPGAPAPTVLLGADTGAAAVLEYVATRTTLARPDAVVVAGLSYPDDAVASFDDELAVRTACPNHRGVLDREGVTHALASSDVHLDRPAAGNVDVPLLVLHGGADEVAPWDHVRRTLEGVATRTEVTVIDGGLHDVLNDVTHRTVAATIVQFLERLKRDGATLRPIALDEVW